MQSSVSHIFPDLWSYFYILKHEKVYKIVARPGRTYELEMVALAHGQLRLETKFEKRGWDGASTSRAVEHGATRVGRFIDVVREVMWLVMMAALWRPLKGAAQMRRRFQNKVFPFWLLFYSLNLIMSHVNYLQDLNSYIIVNRFMRLKTFPRIDAEMRLTK